jgi:hypothetical protein
MGTPDFQPPQIRGVTDAAQLAQGLTSGYATRTEKMAAIYLWVRDELAYVASGEVAKLPVTTLTDGNGDCLDKIQLMAAMLHTIGEESWLIHIAEPSVAHAVLGIQVTDEEATEMSILTGGNGQWYTASYDGRKLLIVDPTTPNVGYIGWLSKDYRSSSSSSSWRWPYPVTFTAAWQNPAVVHPNGDWIGIGSWRGGGLSCTVDGVGFVAGTWTVGNTIWNFSGPGVLEGETLHVHWNSYGGTDLYIEFTSPTTAQATRPGLYAGWQAIAKR